MSQIILYGIKNCDTVRKARRWLDSHKVSYQYHDLRADGLSKAEVDNWLSALGNEVLINRRGTTWRNLTDKEKTVAGNAAISELLLTHPALIKRPLLNIDGLLHVGFSDAQYQQLFAK